MELGGHWRATESSDDLRRALADPDLDDSGWPELPVPGHWRSSEHFARSDGPLVYRRRFSADGPEEAERAFLVFDGMFYQGDVWLDGEYLGDTEGYFFPHRFEVTGALRARRDHSLTVEVGCPRPTDLKAKRNLTGVFQHWDCIDPDWNPGGIWRPVRVERTGPVRIRSFKVLCREATAERAVLDLEASLDTSEPTAASVTTSVLRPGGGTATEHHQQQALSSGANLMTWRVAVERPELWWPRGIGGQPLYRVSVEVRPPGGAPISDRRDVTTGLRQVRVRDFVATVNGERIFLKGANCGPTNRALGEATAEEMRRDVELAAEAGLDLIRVHAHVSRPELYDQADRSGMLIWQDLPLQWGYGNVRRQAMAQAREAVALLGHHPSIAVWCGHNEPMAIAVSPGATSSARKVARVAAAQVLPSWNKTGLDRSLRRTLEHADGSRPVVSHSGIMPHPAWGTDTHLYFGWYHGDERDLETTLARFPVVGRFVSEFGAQAVPESAEFMAPERWPDLDWEQLEQHHGLQRSIFEARVPPAEHATFDSWRQATQQYQATLLRHHIETLRRLKYRPAGGFCMFLLADAQPAVSWSVLDHERRPKPGYRAVVEACAPVVIIADRPARSYQPGERLEVDVHAVSDLRTTIRDAVVEAGLRWPGGARRWRFSGDVPADGCSRIGRLTHTVPAEAASGELVVDLAMRWSGGEVANSYRSRVEVVSGRQTRSPS